MNLRQRAMVFKALGHPARLAVVERLARGECCVCELLKGTPFRRLSGATVSQHLLVLKGAGVIADEKRGKKIFYQLRMPCVAGITLCVGERQADGGVSDGNETGVLQQA
jgi:DNA-binding transcriptional ArsR family regulator